MTECGGVVVQGIERSCKVWRGGRPKGLPYTMAVGGLSSLRGHQIPRCARNDKRRVRLRMTSCASAPALRYHAQRG